MNIFPPLWWSKPSRKQRRRATTTRRRVQLELEVLEGRTLLSSVLPPELLAAAEPVLLSATASAFRTGSIEVAHDVDVFQFVAPLTTRMVIQQSATFDSELDSVLSVFDNTGALIGQNDDMTPNTLHSQVLFDVVAGKAYYVQAAGFEVIVKGKLVSSLGDYALTFSSFADSRIVALDASGSASVAGEIGAAGDVDVFQFVATATGLIVVSQGRIAGSSLDSTLSVYHSSGQLLAFNDDAGTERDSRIGVLVEAGETYYVHAAGFDTSSGAYVLNMQVTAAHPLIVFQQPVFKDPVFTEVAGPISAPLFTGVAGTISAPGEVDLFVFVAPPQAAVVEIHLLLSADRAVKARLTVLDDAFVKVAGGNHSLVAGDVVLQVFVTPGRAYFIPISEADVGLGEYTVGAVDVTPDPSVGRGIGDGKPPTAVKSALAEQPQLVVPPSPILLPAVPPAVGAGAGGEFRAAIAPLGPGGNDASLVLVATLFADARTSAAISQPAVAAPDAELVAALDQVLSAGLADAERMTQAGWLLADDGLAVLRSTVSPLGLAVRSFFGEDAEVLETSGQEIVDNLVHTARALGGAFAATIRSPFEQQLLSAPIGPARRQAPAQEQADPSLPNEIIPDERPAAPQNREPEETAALVALFIAAGLKAHPTRRVRDRRRLGLGGRI